VIDHPRDLAAWQRWQDGRRPLRGVRRTLTRPAEVELVYGGPEPDLVVVVDAWHASVRAAIVAALPHLEPARTLVAGPAGVARQVPWQPARVRSLRAGDVAQALAGARAVLGSGHHLEPGATVHAAAASLGIPFLVAQHGLLTPKAPPLPPRAHLLAWSEADAAFWTSGRDDVTWSVTGSQLLVDAAAAASEVADDRPVYLGQLHGAELPRPDLADAAESFCLAHHATYRPHPSERDRRSLRTHDRWRGLGIEVAAAGPPLREIGRPVVSVFSTGVLEAAAAGLPSYVDHPSAPDWLRDLWHRYDMQEYGGDPTSSPALHPEPARAVAAALVEAAR